ncbi:MAG: hypothetical protein ICV66_10170 [Chitinophagaceae bacterium]|nr:hypothetical protein [Chitinophagaceae bacterium]
MFLHSKKIQAHFKNILQRLKVFAEDNRNIYGMDIQQTKVKDSAFVAIKKELKEYPNTELIYSLINQLRNYIKANNVVQTDYPMMHVDEVDENLYEVMVAIPIDKILEGNGTIHPKRMVLGNILVAEVKGGVETVRKGMAELDNYVHDFSKVSPAIPYESLVTDRSKEADTTKWVTRLYYPVL